MIRLKAGNGVDDVNKLCTLLETAGTSCAYKYSSVLMGFAAEVSQSTNLLTLLPLALLFNSKAVTGN